ncbi:MAG TPA: hypothetical protein VGX50_16255 [Longimicrobium sp.]|nr:hypothetical protein [Longimicrobium sp.]
MTLQLSGFQVNTQPGTPLVKVTENTASPVAFAVTKLDFGFFFNGLVATLNDEPVAQVRTALLSPCTRHLAVS